MVGNKATNFRITPSPTPNKFPVLPFRNRMLLRQLRSGFLLLVLLVSSSTVVAQDAPWNNQRYRWVKPHGTYAIDSLTVIPYSIRLTQADGQLVDTAFYTFTSQQLRWRTPLTADSVLLRFRVLPYQLTTPFALIDTTQRQDNPTGLLIGSYNPYAPGGGLLDGQKLNYTGSFSRGLSFGNRQDLVLNSSFNLQLAGEIGDGIRVTAAITDENLPIQPEGNTRQLRDFDRIFIRLEKERTQLTAGDYELRSPEGYFLQYFKKLEGASFQTSQRVGDAGEWQNSASVAIARGQFRRQLLVAIEGNQGPYKLQGGSGERFIIVLAGTEKVLLDGQTLQRGRDADYTIDYNQGEVTFTPRRLITKDSRITVEFEYADQRYLRSLYATSSKFESGRWQAYANLYSQQDSKTATGDLQLSDAERLLLQQAGDRFANAAISTVARLDAPDSQRATYTQQDTLVNCNGQDTRYQFLRYAPEGLLTATFTFVGAGQGNYVFDAEQTANERVYRWVAPDTLTCAPRGSYEPVRQLVPPQLQRLLSTGGRYQTGKDGSLRAEIAYSQQDLNRFSRLDANDDEGLATRLDWEQQWQLGPDSSSWRLQSVANYEWVQANFRAINPYRSPEFLRDWNLATINGAGNTLPAGEQLAGAGLGLAHPAWGSVQYRWSTFERTRLYQGQRHAGTLNFSHKTWQILAENSWLNSTAGTQVTQFTRPTVKIEKRFARWNDWLVSVSRQAERSERRPIAGAALDPSSFAFERYSARLSSPEQEKWQVSTAFNRRLDYQAAGQDFRQTTQAEEGEVTGQWQPSKSFRTAGNLTYRQLKVRAADLTTQEPAKTLLGRIDMTTNLWRGAVRSNTTYEIGSGQEPRIEFVYLFVGAGQGQYIWLDSLYNNDGKIQPNEMEIAPFPDIADYIRVSIFTDDFIRTDNVTLNQSLQLEPARNWQKSSQGWQKALSRFDWQSSLSINRKVRALDGVQTWNPFQLSLPDSALVAVSANQRHALFFNRRSTKYDLQLEYTLQPRRLVPTTGFESRNQRAGTLRGRWNMTDASTLRIALARQQRTADSEFFNNKDYDLQGYTLEPALSYQPGQDYRITLSYNYLTEENKLPETGEGLQRSEFQLEGNYQQWLRLSASYIKVDLAGDPRSPVGFVLLNGLQTGRNWIWNAALTRQLGRYLQMTLTYEGRQTGEAATVHVGRAQITALF
ncbi:MAG: hypothetical protein DA408_01985 [Bacteroidetes bacterium]|nr:MAG: hypothetical protein DA408_01985 [Bacteroidota bacterium]